MGIQILFQPLSIEIFHCDKCIWVFHLVTIYLPLYLPTGWYACLSKLRKKIRKICDRSVFSIQLTVTSIYTTLCFVSYSDRSSLGTNSTIRTSIEILRLPLANDLDHHHMILDISGGWAEMQRTVLFLHCCNFLSFTITSPVHDPIRSYVDRGDI